MFKNLLHIFMFTFLATALLLGQVANSAYAATPNPNNHIMENKTNEKSHNMAKSHDMVMTGDAPCHDMVNHQNMTKNTSDNNHKHHKNCCGDGCQCIYLTVNNMIDMKDSYLISYSTDYIKNRIVNDAYVKSFPIIIERPPKA